MKKITFILIALFTCSLSYSQIRVITNGDVGVGTTTPTEQLEVAGIAKAEGGTFYKSGGPATIVMERLGQSAMSLGAGNSAGITVDANYNFDFRAAARQQIQDRFVSTGAMRMRIKASNGYVGIGNVWAPTEQLHVGGNIFATGTITPSDRRLKGESHEIQYGLKEILELNPVRYQYNGKANLETTTKHFGLIAQELQEVMPSLVSKFTHEVRNIETSELEAEEEYLKINSGALTYVLIKAIKEQQELIEELSEKVNSLSSVEVNDEEVSIVIASISGDKASALGQNEPNPHSGFTRIPYSIEQGKIGLVNIYDASGTLIKTIQLDGTKGIVDLSMNNMSSGTFTYNLVVDGLVIEAKKMILAK